MRKDLDKVTTESPRRGHSNPSLKTSLRIHRASLEFDEDGFDIDRFELPKVLPISRHRQYGWNCKEFSDLLGPLRKCLRKQVGRPWNDVYSELCESLDQRSLSGIHIWGHVKSEVELYPVIRRDGVICRGYRFHWHGDPLTPLQGLYVHPRTGILCYIEERTKRYRRPENPDIKKIDEFHNYELIKGIWYFVTYHNVPKYKYVMIEGEQVKKEDGFTRMYWMKKQLNSKELRRNKLVNSRLSVA